MTSMTAPGAQAEGQMDILVQAANCFAERGYNATSIDDVARRLGCTKGRIYHFFASKADLFFGVYHVGMEKCFEVSQPIYESDDTAFNRFRKMAYAHTICMMETKSFQRVVMEGVEIQMRGATTPEQRETLTKLQEFRDQYSSLFREMMVEARSDGDLSFPDAGIAVQLIFVSLNSPLHWYTPRDGETEEDRKKLAHKIVTYVLAGLGADKERILL